MNFAIKSSYIKSLLPNLPDAFIRDKGIVVVPVEEVGFKERVKNDIVLVEAVPEFKPTVVKRDYKDEGRLREEREREFREEERLRREREIVEREQELRDRERQVEEEERLRREREIVERERELLEREQQIEAEERLRREREIAERERRLQARERQMRRTNRQEYKFNPNPPRRKLSCREIGVCNRAPSGTGHYPLSNFGKNRDFKGDSADPNKKNSKWNFDLNLNLGN